LKRTQLSALIFGDDTERVRKVNTLLSPYCDTLHSAPSAAIYQQPPKQSAWHVIVVTGLLATSRPSDFFGQLRKCYPGARIIFISDAIEADVEVEARAAGTLFIGSLDAFLVNVSQIVQSVLKKQADTSMGQARHVKKASEPNHSVILVDDDPKILRSIRRTLDGAPYSIHAFDHPRKALQAVDRLQPAVIIADYQMPDMSGVELLERIKRRWPTTIRIIMTGRAEIETVLNAINRCQVYKFIPKPWNADQMRTDIAEAIAFGQLLQGQNIGKPFTDYFRQQRMDRMACVRELATAVCHEMGQPLQTINGWTELLLMDLSSLDSGLATRLTLIRDEVHRLGTVLANLRQLQSYRTVSYPGGTTMIDIGGSADSGPALSTAGQRE
jgi:CheY-like chemotaxis protein